jgi:hypothetical protein
VLPTPLTAGVTYYVIVVDDTHIKLALTLANALIGTPIPITVTATATQGTPSFILTSADGKNKEAGTFVIDVYYTISGIRSLVESWMCSKTPGFKDSKNNNIYIQDILEGSNYIAATDNVAITDIYPLAQPTPLAFGAGSDGTQVLDGQMITAVDLFANDDIPMTLIIDGGWATAAYHSEIRNICENRMDCVGILSTPYDVESSSDYVNDIVRWRKIDDNINSSYVAMYTPHVKIYDKYTDRNMYVSPDGFIAALVAKTAANYEIWYPVGGFKRGVMRVLDSRRRFSKAQMDLFSQNQINSLKFTNGKGIIINDDQTMYAIHSALQELNVRLLLNYIEPDIKSILDTFLFELNDAPTRAMVVVLLKSYLDNIKARRGISDYVLQCDTVNNMAADIDANKLNVSVAIRPIKAVKFIDCAIIITSQSVSFTTALAAA